MTPGIRFPGYTDAFVQEPKVTFGLAPGVNGALVYSHVTVLDSDGSTARSQCNVSGIGSDGTDSCQVPQIALQNGSSIIRWDDNVNGCNVNTHRCLYGAFRAYPSNAAPGAARTVQWANPSDGFYAWALRSDARSCFGLFGASSSFVASTCNPPVSQSTGGCTNADSQQGLAKRWEIHKKTGYGQVLINGWEGGNGTYDCPIASRRFGQDGETWTIYASFSYGPGLDQQK